MIQASELRIGNKLGYAHEGVLYATVSVSQIFENNFTCKQDFARDMTTKGVLGPIRITEDILSKISAYHIGKINQLFVQNQIKDGYMIFIINDSWQSIEFVHHLQNLYFALAKEELDIRF